MVEARFETVPLSYLIRPSHIGVHLTPKSREEMKNNNIKQND